MFGVTCRTESVLNHVEWILFTAIEPEGTMLVLRIREVARGQAGCLSGLAGLEAFTFHLCCLLSHSSVVGGQAGTGEGRVSGWGAPGSSTSKLPKTHPPREISPTSSGDV